MALDKDTGNSLFGGFKSKDKQLPESKVVEHVEIEKKHKEIVPPKPQEIELASQKAKWETLDKVTVLLTPEQKTGLDAVAKSLMKYRAARTKGTDKERITANTILRALIDNFLEEKDSHPLEVLITEEDVKKWIK